MPGTQKPVGAAATIWDHFGQLANNHSKRLAALESQQTQIILDQYGNATVIIGQLNQTVTEGAYFGCAGAQSSTGLTSAGIGVCQTVGSTATFSSGSTSATVASATGLANGMGIAGPGIQAGTTFTISGTTLTLSLPTIAASNSFPAPITNPPEITAFIWRPIGGYTYP